MNRVVINRKETCLSYAFKRTGTKSSVEFVTELNEQFVLLPFSVENAKRGSLVVWNDKAHTISAGYEITEEGMIINHEVLIDYHVGVIEDDAITLVSDCTRKILPNAVPCIRVRSFNEVRYPDFILIQKC
jgi:hypothetical protein